MLTATTSVALVALLVEFIRRLRVEKKKFEALLGETSSLYTLAAASYQTISEEELLGQEVPFSVRCRLQPHIEFKPVALPETETQRVRCIETKKSVARQYPHRGSYVHICLYT